MRIREIAQARVRYKYRKIRVLLNREGWDVGKYLVGRLYAQRRRTVDEEDVTPAETKSNKTPR